MEKITLYHFDKEGVGHYDKNGKSVKKALMQLQLMVQDYVPFGMRKHPIDGLIRCIEVQILLNRNSIMASGSGTKKGRLVRWWWKLIINMTDLPNCVCTSKFAKGIKAE